jgi:hypothetical protein
VYVTAELGLKGHAELLPALGHYPRTEAGPDTYGPASLLSGKTHYGLDLAKFLPALLHMTRWGLVAHLAPRTLSDGRQTPNRFTPDASCKLVIKTSTRLVAEGACVPTYWRSDSPILRLHSRKRNDAVLFAH